MITAGRTGRRVSKRDSAASYQDRPRQNRDCCNSLDHRFLLLLCWIYQVEPPTREGLMTFADTAANVTHPGMLRVV